MTTALAWVLLAGSLAQVGGEMRQAEARLEVPLGSREPVSVTAKIDLPPKLLDEFGDEGIEWEPKALQIVLKSRSRSDGRTVALLPTPSKGNAVEYSYTRPKIQRGKPGQVTFSVPDPWGLREELGPGVFEGELPITIYHQSVMDGKEPLAKIVVPVLLVLPGTRLLGARFSSLEGKGPLRIGQQASVEVSLETFGGSLGAGRLELDFERGLGTSKETLARIPLPLGIPAWDPIEARPGWACHPLWSAVAIPEVERHSEPVGSPIPGLKVESHRLRVDLPDLFQPGQVSGRVSWPTDPNSPEAPSKAVAIEPVDVAAGLLAGPRVAMLGQPIEVYLIAHAGELGDTKTWGDSIPFDPGGPVVGDAAPMLQRLKTKEGDDVVFTGQFYPAQGGTYMVTLGPAAPEQARATLRPVEIRVPFQWGSRIPADPPATVFVDSTPWWWGLKYSAEDGNRDVVTRRGAMGLKLASPDYRDVSVRLVGVYKKDDRGLSDRINPDRDPLIGFEPGGPTWPLNGTEPVQLDLVVDVRPPSPDPDPDHDRRRLRTENCVARWLIVGHDATGRSIARAYSQPFQFRVASQGELEFMRWTWLVIFLGGLIVVVILVVTVKKAKQRHLLASRNRSASVALADEELDAVDRESDLDRDDYASSRDHHNDPSGASDDFDDNGPSSPASREQEFDD